VKEKPSFEKKSGKKAKKKKKKSKKRRKKMHCFSILTSVLK